MGVYCFFSRRRIDIFPDSTKNKAHMAPGDKLLFLYVLESKVHRLDTLLYNRHIFQRFDARCRQRTGGGGNAER